MKTTKPGKNISLNSNKDRNPRDFYQTPFSVTEQFLNQHTEFDLNRTVLEPCCGNGAIYQVLTQYFKTNKIDTNDLFLPGGYDFLKYNGKKYDYIITNPPFSLADEIVQKCKQIAKKQFALLHDNHFNHGINRFNNKIFLDPKYKLKYEYTFVRRPFLTEFIREDGKYNTGMMAYCWFVWEKGYSGEPKKRWINNQQYVLSSKDDQEKDQLKLFNYKLDEEKQLILL